MEGAQIDINEKNKEFVRTSSVNLPVDDIKKIED